MSLSNNYPTTRPSLTLDFANTNMLDPRITFTRSSIATVTNSLGLLQTVQNNIPRFDYDPVTLAPRGLLIEEQRTNLCLRSAGVGGTGWSLFGTGTGVTPVITTNFAVAPDGTTTASRVQVSLGGGTASADQSITTQALTGTSCRGSFYIKTNDGSSKTIYVRGSNSFSIVVDGTWRRYDFDAGTLSGTQFGLGLRGGQTPANDNTADLLVWGAQLEAGSFATSYVPSTQTFTGRTSTGTFIGSDGLIQTAGSGVARMQYNPLNLSVAPFLLLEAAATNLFTNSDFNSGVSGTGLVTSSTMTGPTGATITAAAFGHDGTTTSFLYKNTVAATTQYAISVFVRMDDGNAPVFGSLTATSSLNDFALVVSGGAVPVSTYTVENFGGGLYRVSGSVISQATNLGNNGVIKYSTNSNRTFKTSGWQVEAGSFATSYIPTVATTGNRSADTSTSAATTRNADVASMTGTAFSSWYNATEGTLFSQWDSFSVGAINPASVALVDTANQTNITVNLWQTTTVRAFWGTNSINTLAAVQSINSAAIAFSNASYAISANGASVISGSGTVAIASINQMNIGRYATNPGYLNGHIRRITYYPVRLSNTNLQALTS